MAAKKPVPPPEKTAEQIEYERKYGHPTSPPPPPKREGWNPFGRAMNSLGIVDARAMLEALEGLQALVVSLERRIAELEKRDR